MPGRDVQTLCRLYTYIYIYNYIHIIYIVYSRAFGSLEFRPKDDVGLSTLTISTQPAGYMGKWDLPYQTQFEGVTKFGVREEKQRREEQKRRVEERKSRKKEDTGARNVRKVAKHGVFQ